MEKGLIHVYCGDGKGKTTAATGLAVRAAGCGKKVLFARFLKNENSGELPILRGIPEIEVLPLPREFGFFWTLDDEEKAAMREMYSELWHRIMEKVRKDDCFLLVLDEFTAAYRYELFDREEALSFLRGKPEELEVVLTGREPAPELLELADYVSEIRKVKHPFDEGVGARRGIEY